MSRSLFALVAAMALGGGGCGDDASADPADPTTDTGGTDDTGSTDDTGDDDTGDDDAPDPCDIQGNTTLEELPDSGSAAFVLVDGDYRFIRRPGTEDTSISYIDSTCQFAYGWSRDKPFSDDTAIETSWILNLDTLEFTDIEIPGAVWTVVRNALDSGLVVGKLSFDNGTPDEPMDDESRGFIHNPATGDTDMYARDGFFDIGFTAINEDGTVVGFNDFGTQGFSWAGDEFSDLDDPEAYRLFPFQISSNGTIVGFWGLDENTWFDNSVNPAFIATPSDTGPQVQKYELDGRTGTGLTGLNEAGQLAGIAYSATTSLPVVFTAESAEAAPVFYPLPGSVEPFATGISETGVVYGQTFILEEPRECGGHGTATESGCDCDEGYESGAGDTPTCVPAT